MIGNQDLRNAFGTFDRWIGMFRRVALCLIFLGAVMCAPTSVYAACTASVTNINFGSVDVLPGTAVNLTGAIDLNCTGLGTRTPHRFCINIGSGADFSGSQRQLAFGAARLNYHRYTNAARTQLWGSWETGFNGAGLEIIINSNGSGRINSSVSIYARLFGNQQTAATGSYSTTFPSSPSGVYIRYGSTGVLPMCPGSSGNTTTAGFSVTATVVSTCNVSATNVSFGTIGLLNNNVDAASSVSAQCNNSLPYVVSLNGGNAGAGDPTQRKMAKAREFITYGLYKDAARAQPWGNTIGTNTVAGTGTGLSQTITVYGRVPSQTTGSSGTYSDTIVVTVTY